jgi:hypothetical protein
LRPDAPSWTALRQVAIVGHRMNYTEECAEHPWNNRVSSVARKIPRYSATDRSGESVFQPFLSGLEWDNRLSSSPPV